MSKRVAATAVLGTAVLLLAAYYYFDWWRLNSTPAAESYLVVRIFGALVISAAGWTLITWFASLPIAWRRLFMGWVLYLGLWLAATWPGYLMTDSYAAYRYAVDAPFNAWLGTPNIIAYSAVVQLVPHIGAVAVVQLLLAAFVFTYSTRVLVNATGSRAAGMAFSALLALAPAVLYNVLLLSRDTPFSLMVLWLTAFAFDAARRRSVGLGAAIGMGIAGAAVVAMRGDGILALLPALAVVLVVGALKVRLASTIAVAATLLLLTGLMPGWVGERRDDWAYEMSLVVNPLGYILQRDYYARDKAAVISVADRVLDVRKVVAQQNPFEIPAYWDNAVRPESTQDERDEFERMYRRLLVENSGLFLANRAEMFAASTGLNRSGFRYADVLQNWNWRHYVAPEEVNLSLDRPFPNLFARADAIFRDTKSYHGAVFGGAFLFWNFLPELIVLCVAVLAYVLSPALAAAALVPLLRVPAIVLFAPAAQFKYFLSVELSGMFIFCAGVALLTESARQGLVGKFASTR